MFSSPLLSGSLEKILKNGEKTRSILKMISFQMCGLENYAFYPKIFMGEMMCYFNYLSYFY